MVSITRVLKRSSISLYFLDGSRQPKAGRTLEVNHTHGKHKGFQSIIFSTPINLSALRAIKLAPKPSSRGAVDAKAKYHTGPSRLAYHAESILTTNSLHTTAIYMTSFSHRYLECEMQSSHAPLSLSFDHPAVLMPSIECAQTTTPHINHGSNGHTSPQ